MNQDDSPTRRVVGVIPARMGSTRFPGKPLAPILGKPMIQHVYERCARASLLDDVVIATCDTEIACEAEAFGARIILTSPAHERASDRTAEAARSLEADVVVMVQGDEPMIDPALIDRAALAMLDDPEIACVNLAAPIACEREFRDPNTIKVITDVRGDAVYFSREPIPTVPAGRFEPGGTLKQVCVIPFRRDALERFASLAPTPAERAESIDMLRFVEHSIPVRMVRVESGSHAVDTPGDLELVVRLLSAGSQPSASAA